MSERAMAMRVQKIFLLGAFLWFLGWLWKVDYYLNLVAVGWFASPEAPVFPAMMSDYRTAAFFYLLPFLGMIAPMIRWSRGRALFASATMAVGALGCLGHYHFFNDATFTTAFWASLWLVWLAWNSEREDSGLEREAKGLVKATVAMIFFGGAVGKFTGTYWSGEVFHDIYFVQKDYFIYNYLEANFAPEEVATAAKYFSRMAIIGEVLVVISALVLKYRYFTVFVLATTLTMVFISTASLFSVMAPLIGILAANLLWETESLGRLAPVGRSD